MVHVITPPPADPSREDIIWLAGPRFLGIVFNWSLLGVLTTQVYIYYLNFPKDKRMMKALVYTVYLLDWAQTCSATYDAFHWFVYGWGDIAALYDLYSSFLNVPILSSVIGAAVQIFFGWRIWMFSKSRVVFALVIVLALLQLSGGIAVGYYIYNDASEVTRSSGLVRAVGVRLAGSAFVDTVIAVSMTCFLVRSQQEALGYMQNVLTRLIRLTIETGTVTAIAAIVDLVFFLREHNGLHQVSGVILCKLYSNTLLVLLNNRLAMTNGTKSNYSSERTLTFNASPPIHSNLGDPERNVPDIQLDLMKARSGTETKQTSSWGEGVEIQ